MDPSAESFRDRALQKLVFIQWPILPIDGAVNLDTRTESRLTTWTAGQPRKAIRVDSGSVLSRSRHYGSPVLLAQDLAVSVLCKQPVGCPRRWRAGDHNVAAQIRACRRLWCRYPPTALHAERKSWTYGVNGAALPLRNEPSTPTDRRPWPRLGSSTQCPLSSDRGRSPHGANRIAASGRVAQWESARFTREPTGGPETPDSQRYSTIAGLGPAHGYGWTRRDWAGFGQRSRVAAQTR